MKTFDNIFAKILSGIMVTAAMCMSTSCLNEYLDKAPDAGLTEEEVFSKYDNFQDFFYSVYYGANFTIKALYPFWFDGNNQKLTLYALTDMCDMSRLQRSQPAKQGDGSQLTWAVGYNNDASSHAAKVTYSWKCIRVANKAIENIDMLQDATEREKEDLLAQAYFVRAFCHFELFRFYGSLPYIDKVLGADDEWDLPRPTDYDMLMRFADDFQTAADHFRNAGIMRRDPSGNLSSADQDKPAGVTALAMKGRALLYAASPLSNHGEDPDIWAKAAEASPGKLDRQLLRNQIHERAALGLYFRLHHELQEYESPGICGLLLHKRLVQFRTVSYPEFRRQVRDTDRRICP